MAASQFNRYIWLVDTIRRAGRISRQDINRRWAVSSLNDSKETFIHERTFHRYKDAIQELFDIEIRCDRAAGGLYYIAGTGNESRTKQWLLSQFAVSNSLHESRQLQGRVLYESIPRGTEYLTQIVEAMRDNRKMRMSHQSFTSPEPHLYIIAPYCLKVFKQRWYLFGKTTEYREPRIFALDRIISLETLTDTFTLPKDFDAEAYFIKSYGVFVGEQFKPEKIRVRVIPEVAAYLRSLPLHHSQKEEEPCVFSWFVAPTFDFFMELRTHGSNLEVLSPAWLRDEFREEAEKTVMLYKN